MNTVRGSGFPEISLDDLAIEFFDSSADRGRSGSSSNSDVRGRKDVGDTGSGCGGSVRRGRSVSRQATKGNGGDSSAGGRVISGSNNNTGNNNSRRRRSVSAVRYQISDSEVSFSCLFFKSSKDFIFYCLISSIYSYFSVD